MSLPEVCGALGISREAEDDGADILLEHKRIRDLDAVCTDYELDLSDILTPDNELVYFLSVSYVFVY
jgi:hypothetical protein